MDVEAEMMWTSWQDSCRDPHITSDGDLRQCRRRHDHDGDHACGFGSKRRTWSVLTGPEG